MQDARPAADSFVETPQVVFFIWTVNRVIVAGKANQHRIHPENRFEMTGDGDRPATSDKCGRIWPFIGERRAGGLKGWVVDGHFRPCGGAVGFEGDATIGGQKAAYHCAEVLADHMGILLTHQAK